MSAVNKNRFKNVEISELHKMGYSFIESPRKLVFVTDLEDLEIDKSSDKMWTKLFLFALGRHRHGDASTLEALWTEYPFICSFLFPEGYTINNFDGPFDAWCREQFTDPYD